MENTSLHVYRTTGTLPNQIGLLYLYSITDFSSTQNLPGVHHYWKARVSCEIDNNSIVKFIAATLLVCRCSYGRRGKIRGAVDSSQLLSRSCCLHNRFLAPIDCTSRGIISENDDRPRLSVILEVFGLFKF